MRVVQLDIEGHRVEFHPYVTVIRGLENELRQQIVQVVGALAAGEAAAAGLVEAHGVFLDLSEDALELLDLPRPGFGLDLVVNAAQVPRTLEPGVLARNDLDRRRETLAAQLARAEAEAERARLALATSREALETVANGSSGDAGNTSASLDSLRREEDERVAAREAAETRLEMAKTAYAQAERTLAAQHERQGRLRQHRAHASRVAGEAAQALEAARATSDPFASTAFDAARERLRLLQAPDVADSDSETAGTDATANGVSATPMTADDAAAEVDRLEVRHAELEASLLALDTVDPFAVETALEQVRSNDDIELVPSADAQRVADEWVRNEAALSGESSFEETSGNVLATARRRLDTARAAVFEAERAVRVPEVDRHDVEALENAHEEVLLAQDRADKRFGGDRARQRLQEARAAEQAILDRIGFDTYAAFMMGTSIQHVDTEREHELEASRAELAAAEDALGVLEQGIDAELALAALLARRRELRDEAARVLGRDPGEDLEWELRHHRVEVRGGGERAQRLRSALESAGMMLGGEQPPKRMLVDLAQIWLEEQRQTDEHRAAIAQDLAEVDAQLDAARKGLWRARKDDDGDDGDRLEREIDHARDALNAAEERLQRQSEIEADISQRKSNLTRALVAEREAVTQLSAAEEDEAEAARAEHESATDLARLNAELAAALAAERGVMEELDELTRIVEAMGDPQNRSDLQAAVEEAEAAVSTADAAAAAARSDLSEIDGLLEHATSGNGDTSVATSPAAVEELEWYLLSRLAQLRALSYAGSLPCVLDDALRGVEGDGLVHLLGRLERMSSAVQIIILSDDDEIAAWADGIGADRAITLYPVPV